MISIKFGEAIASVTLAKSFIRIGCLVVGKTANVTETQQHKQLLWRKKGEPDLAPFWPNFALRAFCAASA